MTLTKIKFIDTDECKTLREIINNNSDSKKLSIKLNNFIIDMSLKYKFAIKFTGINFTDGQIVLLKSDKMICSNCNNNKIYCSMSSYYDHWLIDHSKILNTDNKNYLDFCDIVSKQKPNIFYHGMIKLSEIQIKEKEKPIHESQWVRVKDYSQGRSN